MRTVIGFDGGGSRCEAYWIDEAGRILDSGRGGTVSEWYGGAPVVLESARAAVEPMLARTEPMPDGVAFTTVGGPRVSEWLTDRFGADRTLPVHEPDGMFASAVLTHGVLIMAGTGSFVDGRTEDGRRAFAGGTGPVLGDDGSGFDIGLHALKLTSIAEQIPSKAGGLTRDIHERLRTKERGGLVHLFHQEYPGRREIADLAKLVSEHAAAGDPTALEVYDICAARISYLVREVVEALGLPEGTRVIFGGGALSPRPYQDAVVRHVTEATGKRMRFEPQRYPSAIGNALLWLRAQGHDWDEAFLTTLDAEYARVRTERS